MVWSTEAIAGFMLASWVAGVVTGAALVLLYAMTRKVRPHHDSKSG